MKATIDIDDDLLARVRALCGTSTDAATVAEALRTVIRLHEQEEILHLAGKIHWEGDLDDSRLGRNTGERDAA